MQLNSFADIFLSHFIHRVWTPGVLQPFWNSKANAEGTSSWELATIKKFVKTFLAVRPPMFPSVSGKLTHSCTRAETKEKKSDPVNFFPCNYHITSTWKSIKNTIFLWHVFCGIIFFIMRGLSSHIFLTTWICILEAYYWFWISNEITSMIHILWLIPKCYNCINYILQSIL